MILVLVLNISTYAGLQTGYKIPMHNKTPTATLPTKSALKLNRRPLAFNRRRRLQLGWRIIGLGVCLVRHLRILITADIAPLGAAAAAAFDEEDCAGDDYSQHSTYYSDGDSGFFSARQA